MSVYEYIIGGVLIVASLLVILVVLLQEGHQANVGVISGAADSFLDKGAAKTLDQKLSKWTKVIAISFFVLVLGGMMVTKFLSNSALKSYNGEGTTTTTTTAHDHDHDHEGEDAHEGEEAASTTKAGESTTKAAEGDSTTKAAEGDSTTTTTTTPTENEFNDVELEW